MTLTKLTHMNEPNIETLIFGGTFDPIHHGHLIVARHVAEALSINRVLLVPAAANPLKGHAIATGPQRLEMARLATAGDALFEVSDVEVTRQPPSYTIDTIQTLQRQGIERPGLLIGADSIDELPQWHRVGELLQAVQLVVVPRPPRDPQAVRQQLQALARQLPSTPQTPPAATVIAGPMVEISATNIRKRAQNGRPIRYLVPESVAEFIKSNELYKKL